MQKVKNEEDIMVDRLVNHSVKVQFTNGDRHNMLVDALDTENSDELVRIEKDRPRTVSSGAALEIKPLT